MAYIMPTKKKSHTSNLKPALKLATKPAKQAINSPGYSYFFVQTVPKHFLGQFTNSATIEPQNSIKVVLKQSK